MKKIIENETTVVLVSHDLELVQEVCDKVIWLDKGKIRVIGDPKEICGKYIIS